MPNLIQEVTALRWDVWINWIRQFQVKYDFVESATDQSSQQFDLGSTFDLEVAFHMWGNRL